MPHALAIVAALVVAGAFSLAGVAKARDRAATTTAARDLGVRPTLAPTVATVLPVLELATALLLLIGALSRTLRIVGGVGAITLLAAFSMAIARTLKAGRRPVCHCFGALASKPIGPDSLVRNGALAALAVVAVVS